MLIIFLSFLFQICQIFAQTTTTTCITDPLIYKLDLRDYLNQLGPQYTIQDIDPSNLCDLVKSYDYVWLTHIWTPSEFNYQNNINPTLANDYKITKNIKEYTLDPVLGTTQDLIQLKQSLNQICYHTKFLGEFSFYIGRDSSLIQNKTRFLTIPFDQISRFYNPRYDKEGFIWAVDDFGRTIPNSAVWNLFSQTVITDIKDVIYRQILTKYKLDGIVFLQPSLGLYSFNTNFYQPEISYFGQSGYLQDFYVNFGLQNTVQTYFFMGGEDNLNSGQNLLNQGLQLIYSGQINQYDRTWALMNFTFDPNYRETSVNVGDRTATRSSGSPTVSGAFIKQVLPLNQKSCFRLAFKKVSYTIIGLGIRSYLQQRNHVVYHTQTGSGLYGVFHEKFINTEDADLNMKGTSFYFGNNDQIELQYDPLNQTLVIRMFQTNLRQQMYIPASPSSLYYMVAMGKNYANYLISFPFNFSPNLRSLSSVVNDGRGLTVNQTQAQLQFAQILPNFNLLNTTTLNINIKKLPANQIVGVGICNQQLVTINQHTWDPTKSGSGAYMMLSNGKTFNSEKSYNDIQTAFTYNEGDTIRITYFPGQRLEFYDNDQKYNNVTVKKHIQNVNFCVAFTTLNTEFYLLF